MFNFIIQCFNKIRIVYISKKLSNIGGNPYFGRRGVIVGGEGISIGEKFSIGDNFKLQVWTFLKENMEPPNLLIGDNVSMMDNCQISCSNRITIGEGCLFGDNVFVTDNFHGKSIALELNIPPVDRKLYSKGSVIIGKNVWIGRNVCIMPGVTIGDGTVVGANSVVTHDILENSVVAGVPAKTIRIIEEKR